MTEERERCQTRYSEIGPQEYSRLQDLIDEAQRLCASLVWLKHPRREHLLRMAEDRRERRSQHLWPWVRFYDRHGVLR